MATKHPDSSEQYEQEARLIEQLKLACGKDNKEVDLKKSSQALHGMAKLYAANTEHKKLNYIRSAALFNAAIIRDKENNDIKRTLNNLCSTVLNAAKAEMNKENLVEFSKEVKQKLESYRQILKGIELPLIPDNVEGEELVALQKQKIASVKKMQDDVTANYTELMKYVSDKCEKIMGKPPCKYTVAGMGSLARAQITLYSDFEHVIVLDDKVENMNKQEREKVMRYFRWFTTIFHIIVINLGETIIPAVAIPTLNGEKGDWFFDSITPRGISFDGMMPHASKMPLGRQQPTKNKPWKTELIKPVVEMLKYLDSELDMKQGYHLSDILSKTCYVAGDQSLYKNFERRANLIVVENDKSSEFKQVKEQINEDLNTFMMRHQVEFLRFAAKENNIKQTTHKLKFMVAVALEIRFKMYMKSRKQEDAFSVIDDDDIETLVTNLVALVGKESLIQFVTTTTQLTEHFWSTDFGSFNNRMITLTTRILTLSMLNMQEEFEKECQLFVEDETNITEETFDIVLKFIRDIIRYKAMFENNPTVGLIIAKNTLEYCKRVEEEFVAKAFMFYFLVRMGDITDEVEMLNNQLQVILKGSRLICRKKHKNEFGNCWWAMFCYASTLAGMKQPELAIDVFRSLSQLNRFNSDYTNNWDCQCSLLIQAYVLLVVKEFTEAKLVLSQLLTTQGIFYKYVKIFRYFLLAKCHFGLKNYIDSFICNVHAIRGYIAIGLQLETGMRENTFVTFHFLKRFMSGEESNEELEAQWRILLDNMCDDTSDDTSDYTTNLSYREKLKGIELPLIPDNVEGEELVALQKQKIASVKKMQDDVTANYTELMKYVSDKCEKIMGKPPCKYTVAGMGSLARAQITLYSDFEHVIVLDDKVENMNKQEREKVMRYFRWFTTIFHIIVINLGETIIPAVAIPTLNGEKGDWFFDSITPRGISFDGMMPHASKMPLGRQQPTKNKPWKTELIKPVVEMLKYLDSELDMKQGYHLSDILSKTCYVAGDQSLYKNFERRANLIVVENDKSSEFKQVKEQINEDLNTFMMRHQVEFLRFAAKENNIKRLIYRNATLFIAALGRIHHLPDASCFDILDRLKDIGFFDEETTHKLKFMVAVALEIRFKMYMKSRKQEDAFSVIDDDDIETLVTNLVALVGKESLIQFVTTTTQLTEHFWSTDFGSFNNRMITLTTRILTLSMLNMQEEFEKECQLFVEDETNITEETFDIVLKFIRDIIRYKAMFENNPTVGLIIAKNTLEYCKRVEEEFVAKAFMFYFLVRMGDITDEVEMLNNQLQTIQTIGIVNVRY
ncbi:uncharacterized protein LOC144747086 [Ciona intestinalis]